MWNHSWCKVHNVLQFISKRNEHLMMASCSTMFLAQQIYDYGHTSMDEAHAECRKTVGVCQTVEQFLTVIYKAVEIHINIALSAKQWNSQCVLQTISAWFLFLQLNILLNSWVHSPKTHYVVCLTCSEFDKSLCDSCRLQTTRPRTLLTLSVTQKDQWRTTKDLINSCSPLGKAQNNGSCSFLLSTCDQIC